MGSTLFALVWVLNFAISVWNAYAVGKVWVDARVAGGRRRVVCWAGAVMLASGFTWCYLIFLALTAHRFGWLTEEEYGAVKRHPEGARIVEPLRSVRAALPLIRWHHERMDGGGYPDGMFGGSIPLLARLLAVADVYDALRSDRPYRAGMPHERCLEVLAEGAAGGGLDPELVRVFCEAPAAAAPA